jgi:hypothetical protein
VANVEAMTLRVWVAEIETVIFGKDGQRELVRMRGAPRTAQALADGLKQFGESRSMVVAPSTVADQQRLTAMATANHLVNAGTANPMLATIAAAQLTALNANNCRHCNAPMLASVSQCGNCGQESGSYA